MIVAHRPVIVKYLCFPAKDFLYYKEHGEYFTRRGQSVENILLEEEREWKIFCNEALRGAQAVTGMKELSRCLTLLQTLFCTMCLDSCLIFFICSLKLPGGAKSLLCGSKFKQLFSDQHERAG